jgi:Uma2 family endonuclease
VGNIATPEFLIARWNELCRDPSLEDLPYKIELNASGKIEMSPASNRHGRLQSELGFQLRRELAGGCIISECSIFTTIGIRVADIAWASDAFMKGFGEITPYMRAPEICAEIASPSNPPGEMEEKTRAYLKAGAHEVWIVGEDGNVRYFGPAGEKSTSDFPVTISLPPPIKGKS